MGLLIKDTELGEIEIAGGSTFFETKEGDAWFNGGDGGNNSPDVEDQVAEIKALVHRLMEDLKAHALLHPFVPV